MQSLVLIIACPCALDQGRRTALMAGTGCSAKMGFDKWKPFFKKCKRFKTVVFDKHRTITIGQPLVTDVVGDEARVLTLAASLELFQNIPARWLLIQKKITPV